MKTEHHIVYVSDAKYRRYVDVSARSMRNDKIGQTCFIHVVDVDAPEIAERLKTFPDYHGSKAMFAKLLIPELFPDLDWVLYVDGDTLGIGDVSEVFQYCDESKLIVGSRDPEDFNLGPDYEDKWMKEQGLPSFKYSTYICDGVMLMNLKAMRAERITEKCLQFISEYGAPPLVDQTVFNYICRGRIGLLPKEWGVFSMCPGDVDFTKSAIIHFPQDLPWERMKPNKLINDFVWAWWKVERSSPRSRSTEDVQLSSFNIQRPVGWVWRRAVFLLIKHCPWLVTWSKYLSARLRPVRGFSRAEREFVVGRLEVKREREEVRSRSTMEVRSRTRSRSTMDVAVLMTCHNRREKTIRCLESLVVSCQSLVGDSRVEREIGREISRVEVERGREISHKEHKEHKDLSSSASSSSRVEVFLVDDGSSDGTSEAVEKLKLKVEVEERNFKIHLIKGDGTLYWAKGMELAWKTAMRRDEGIAPYQHFLWLNDDTILSPNSLCSLCSTRLNNTVVCGGLRDEATGRKICGLKEGGIFTGNVVLVPREVMERVGIICGEFAHAWADTDYAMRCKRAGVRVVEVENVGTTDSHDLRPALRGKTLRERWALLRDPKGWNVHDLWLYRRRNWGVCAAIVSSLHLIFHVLKGER